MTDFQIRTHLVELAIADQQRIDQAYWAASCELGPEPDWKKSPLLHKWYSQELSKRAREKAKRLI